MSGRGGRKREDVYPHLAVGTKLALKTYLVLNLHRSYIYFQNMHKLNVWLALALMRLKTI